MVTVPRATVGRYVKQTPQTAEMHVLKLLTLVIGSHGLSKAVKIFQPAGGVNCAIEPVSRRISYPAELASWNIIEQPCCLTVNVAISPTIYCYSYTDTIPQKNFSTEESPARQIFFLAIKKPFFPFLSLSFSLFSSATLFNELLLLYLYLDFQKHALHNDCPVSNSLVPPRLQGRRVGRA